ncbi:hypothetical protein I4699_01170 [Xanthomonas hortorum pv. carotae]|nr:hypothetical protein [Xanthomonas hortorum pv. carotae]
MSRFTLGVQATLLLPSASHALVDADAAGYGLQFGLRSAMALPNSWWGHRRGSRR